LVTAIVDKQSSAIRDHNADRSTLKDLVPVASYRLGSSFNAVAITAIVAIGAAAVSAPSKMKIIEMMYCNLAQML
jgi:hypothetical protein